MFKTAADMAIRPTRVAADENEPGWNNYWTIHREHLTAAAEAIAMRDGQVRAEMPYSQSEQCARTRFEPVAYENYRRILGRSFTRRT
jgi:hypothetical protein